jgi:hypothetical protein
MSSNSIGILASNPSFGAAEDHCGKKTSARHGELRATFVDGTANMRWPVAHLSWQALRACAAPRVQAQQ